jgi:adenylylsulfate kinase
MSTPGFTYWLTGLSGAGKTTLARALEASLRARGGMVAVLDGDAVRTGLCRDLGFSAADRRENIRRVAEVAKLMNGAGLTVVCALVSPLRADRELARTVIGTDRFIEVHVATPLAVCEARDPKGLYKSARAGLLAQFTGVSAPYEEPAAPALVLDMGMLEIDEAVGRLLAYDGADRAWGRSA